ncbi:Uncharacterized conserved protein YlxW, UPF0749 family [Promicromonospora thailandica]|uniref:Uncharacterized conserved protein YlxW, UPF0749 family n=2 Tax=Promicromonospora thailandica TaxID=765201 RepID=A0A9X2G4A0_9MICO|nr:Uncharacterized conserved protein YlxW, UPF0749 family [Promicromonospora thailandica]BFF16958.1 DUF881 domain-containing protein [Promicromonospora thailandica]
MTLLREVTEAPLDPGYALMAERRARAAAAADGTTGVAPARRRLPGVLTMLLVAAVLGAATTVAVLDLRAPQPEVSRGRALLIEQIRERGGQVEALSGRAAALSAEVDGLQGAGVLPSALLEISALDRWVNGAVAVRGPGLVVRLTDGSGGGLVEPGDAPAESRVRDADVQFVVNELWAAGAEAVAVNDQRLTSLSAIRNAGDAILVDLQPLNGPTYTIEAVGDPEDMQVEFARSAGLGFLQLLSAEYDIKNEVTTSEEMFLPGAGSPTLRYAHVPRPGAGPEEEDG